MLELFTKNFNLVVESPDKSTAIWKRPVLGAFDYIITTECGTGDFLVATLNDSDFEKGALEKDGKDIAELVKDGETTAVDWVSQNLIVAG